MLLQRERIWGKRGAGGNHPHQIKDLSLGLWRKKVPELRRGKGEEGLCPISEPPRRSRSSDALLMHFRAHQRERFIYLDLTENRFSEPPTLLTSFKKELQNGAGTHRTAVSRGGEG